VEPPTKLAISASGTIFRPPFTRTKPETIARVKQRDPPTWMCSSRSSLNRRKIVAGDLLANSASSLTEKTS
jgi:hypothetical protein